MAKVLDLAQLRREAEARLPARRSRGPAPAAAEETRAELVHELDVHRIELEMQNEELRRAHAELEKAHDLYRDLYDFAPVGYFTISPAGTVEEVNLTGAALLGSHRSRLVDRPFAFFVAPGNGVAWRRLVVRARQADGPSSDTIEMRRRDGSAFTAHVVCQAPGRGEERAILRVAVTDVTEQRRLEAEAAENKARLEVVQSHPEPLLLARGDGRVVTVNDALTRRLGYRREDVPTLAAWQRRAFRDPSHPPGMLAAAAAPDPSAYGPGEPATAERSVTAQDGTVRQMQVSRVQVGEYLLVSLVDVTDRVESEERLRERDALLDAIFEGTVSGMVVLGDGGKVLRANRTFRELWGIPEEAVTRGAGAVLELVLGKVRDPEGFLRAEERLQVSQAVAREEVELVDGRVLERLSRPFPFGGPGGRLDAYRDVTEHRRAEQEVRKGHEFLRKVLETTHDGYVIVDAGGMVREVNGAFCAMTGYRTEELLGRRASILAESTGEEVARRLAGTAAEGFARFETRLLHQDGRLVEVEVSLSHLSGDAGLFVAFVRDRTEARRLESQLAIASRLGAMGSLVAGLAHEINNPLAATVASLDVALKDARSVVGSLMSGEAADPSDAIAGLGDLVSCLSDAMEGAVRIKAIVQKLVFYGRPSPVRRPMRLLDAVHAAVRLLPAHLGARAEVLVEGGGDVVVDASASQVELLVANLLANATQAIPEGRRGRVVVRVIAADPGTARLEVSDDGMGMDAEQRERAFDPFFTTRAPGNGMGLGLPICQAIAMANGGTLSVTSAPGGGSTFRLELPRPDAG